MEIDALQIKETDQAPHGGVIKHEQNNRVRVAKSADFLVTNSLDYFKQFGEFSFLIDPLIPKGVLIELGGREGSCKSLVVLTIIKAFLKRESLWGKYPVLESGPILLIDEETPGVLFEQRRKQLGLEGFSTNAFRCLHYEGIKIDNDMDFERLKNWVKAYRPRLVLIDSLVRIHRRGENSATAMAFISDRLREIVNLGPTVLFTHHHSKKGESRGSTEIMAGVDIEYSLKKESDSALLLRSEKTRIKPLDPVKLRIETTDETIRLEYVGTIEDTVWKEVERCMVKNYRYFNQIFAEVSLAHPEITEATLRRLLRKYIENGRIRANIDHLNKNPGRPPIQYRLAKEVEEEKQLLCFKLAQVNAMEN
jgi:predicted ATP-dependent serine protease